MKKLVFYKCTICGNVAIKLVDKNTPLFCCGQQMQQINPNTTDGAMEKHVPQVILDKNIVTVVVGSTWHPMTEEHYISHIVLETNKGFALKQLSYTDEPKATFVLSKNEKATRALAYCNLHGLWENQL